VPSSKCDGIGDLDTLADVRRERPHDTSDTPRYNQALSVRRANAVTAELVRNGVPRNVIAIHGFESTFKDDARVLDWTQEQATMELTARLREISLGHQRRDHQ